MLFVTICFSFIILTIYAGSTFLMEGGNISDMFASVTALLSTLFVMIHVFGVAALGQMVKSEVRDVHQLCGSRIIVKDSKYF